MLINTSPHEATRASIHALAACVAAFMLAACSPKTADRPPPNTSADASPTVTVTATDFAFDAPAQIPAGMTTMTMVNRGQEMHQVQLVRLAEGKTVNDLVATFKQPGPPPAWAVSAGGPNAAAPSGSSQASFMLAPGNYAMLCFIPSPDHVPHIGKGMVRPLTVTAVENVSNTMPQSDNTITMTEYAFNLSAPLAAGIHTLRVDNQGKQDHELLLLRLAPGKTLNDVVAWVDNQVGPPPADPLGGLTDLPNGADGFFTVNLTPGHYALVCFVPDAKDGKPHAAHGMTKEFTI
jgi:hypothetical protein